ncbi:MAG: DUF373 family protein [Methanophagales archaeon ANME-1-THS]|nr:MAG: DUF373 family protein [Methanophagales archaeon ANME-1-THS]
MEGSMRSDTRTLIICVDRDNDLGEKTGLEAPIIGRDAVLAAGTKLALADSEESDINAIFEAVRIYERLHSSEEGGEAEVVVLAGDKKVGVESDRRIGQELDAVLSSFKANSAILVSDGAGDEWIIPIIQSRVKIDSVRRVVVKQSENLESTFYVIKRMLEDPKFSRMFLPPIGLILFLFAISLLLGFSGKAFGLILGFIGIYALLKGLGHENLIIELIESMKQSLYSGKISFIMYIVAIVLIFAGTFQGIMGYTKLAPELKERIVLSMMYYIKMTIWWYIGAVLAPLFGKVMSMLIERERIVRHWAILFSVIASGLLLWGGSESIIWLSKGNYTMGYLILTLSILGAIILSFIGVKISLYIRSSLMQEKMVQAAIDTEESTARD